MLNNKAEQKQSKIIKESSSPSESFDSNFEFNEKEGDIQQIDNDSEFKRNYKVQQDENIKTTQKISSLLQGMRSSHSTKNKSNEIASHRNTQKLVFNQSEGELVEELAADTSGVTDIEMMLESHQDMLQFIHVMAQVSELNIS